MAEAGFENRSVWPVLLIAVLLITASQDKTPTVGTHVTKRTCDVSCKVSGCHVITCLPRWLPWRWILAEGQGKSSGACSIQLGMWKMRTISPKASPQWGDSSGGDESVQMEYRREGAFTHFQLFPPLEIVTSPGTHQLEKSISTHSKPQRKPYHRPVCWIMTRIEFLLYVFSKTLWIRDTYPKKWGNEGSEELGELANVIVQFVNG